MPPPTQLAIATSSVQRLIKEEASYHKELTKQEARLAQLQQQSQTNGGIDADENAGFQLKQEMAAIEETKAIFPSLRVRIASAVVVLEEQLEQAAEGSPASETEVTKAREVLTGAKANLAEGE